MTTLSSAFQFARISLALGSRSQLLNPVAEDLLKNRGTDSSTEDTVSYGTSYDDAEVDGQESSSDMHISPEDSNNFDSYSQKGCNANKNSQSENWPFVDCSNFPFSGCAAQTEQETVFESNLTAKSNLKDTLGELQAEYQALENLPTKGYESKRHFASIKNNLVEALLTKYGLEEIPKIGKSAKTLKKSATKTKNGQSVSSVTKLCLRRLYKSARRSMSHSYAMAWAENALSELELRQSVSSVEFQKGFVGLLQANRA